MSRLSVATLLASLTLGCVHPFTQPHSKLPESVPLSETAVFIAIDQRDDPDQRANQVPISTVRRIDGKRVGCHLNYGCPVWVRVEPGPHVFHVRYANRLVEFGHFENITITDLTAFDVEVPDMKAGHVYVARYREIETEDGDEIEIRVEDLGPRPSYGLWFPFGGSPATNYPAEF